MIKKIISGSPEVKEMMLKQSFSEHFIFNSHKTTVAFVSSTDELCDHITSVFPLLSCENVNPLIIKLHV